MTSKDSPEIDDELFNEVYGKEYTGPPGSNSNAGRNGGDSNKLPPQPDHDAKAGSDGEDELLDPNAVPTDFTSREAKAWVARAKATEKNWKKRKEEEMICKLCGVSGHFTQGCPSTLGGSRRSSDYFQRVPARDKNVRALFTEKVIQRIERDNSCKIKMDEKFIIVSSRDQSSMTKGVDAVHKVIQDESGKGSSRSQRSRSTSPVRNSPRPSLKRSESHESDFSPRGPPLSKFSKPERYVESHLREDIGKSSRSPQAYGFDGGRGKSFRSRSPPRSNYSGNRYSTYNSYNQNVGPQKSDGWDIKRRGADDIATQNFEHHPFHQSLEQLELEFQRKAVELGKILDREEDEENYRYREAIREIRESYMKKLAVLRNLHGKQWEDFLQISIQKNHQTLQGMSASNSNIYNHTNYLDYDRSANPKYSVGGLPVDSGKRYSIPVENFPTSRASQSAYGEFQLQRQDKHWKDV